ncbi:hypothetical protein [Ihuprevotella massiliensis]|uniref:hypothetical protein n=1 Tax=Ihuprevotella massiliensis TaxID=1852368 RepID=UPI00094F06E8
MHRRLKHYGEGADDSFLCNSVYLDNLLLRDNYKSTHIGTLLEGRQNYDGQTMKMLKEVCSSLPTPQA